MKRLKIPPIAIAAIGVIVCLGIVGGIFALMIKPTQDNIAAQKSIIDADSNDALPSSQAAARKQVTVAQEQVAATQQKWGEIEKALMPAYDVSLDRLTSWKQLSNELTYNLGPDIERWIPRTGVTPLSTVSIAAPPTSPNAITNAPLIIPLGTVTVQGDFRRILYSFLKWNDFNRLVLADGLALHGNSPNMTATYTAKVIIFPQGDTNLAPSIGAAGSGVAGGSAAGGGPGGPAGGGSPTSNTN